MEPGAQQLLEPSLPSRTRCLSRLFGFRSGFGAPDRSPREFLSVPPGAGSIRAPPRQTSPNHAAPGLRSRRGRSALASPGGSSRLPVVLVVNSAVDRVALRHARPLCCRSGFLWCGHDRRASFGRSDAPTGAHLRPRPRPRLPLEGGDALHRRWVPARGLDRLRLATRVSLDSHGRRRVRGDRWNLHRPPVVGPGALHIRRQRPVELFLARLGREGFRLSADRSGPPRQAGSPTENRAQEPQNFPSSPSR